MKKMSGILSVALSGFLVYIFDKIWGSRIDWEKVKEIKIGAWLSTELNIRLVFVILFLILLVIIYLLIKRFLIRSTIYNRKQQKLRKFNELLDSQNGLLFRWGVYFEDSGEPFISDLTIFCTKHEGPPLRLMDDPFGAYYCPYKNCNTKFNSERTRLAQNAIESTLIDKWNKLNN